VKKLQVENKQSIAETEEVLAAAEKLEEEN